MGFDASEVGRDPDAERLLRSSYSPSMNYEVRRLQKMLRSIRIDPMPPSLQGSMVPIIGDVRSAEMIRRTGVNLSLAVFPETVRRGVPGLSGNFTGLSNYPRMQSDVLKQGRMFGNLALSGSIAQAFKLQWISSAHSSAWSLHRVPSVRTPALQSLLKSVMTIGPIVISPDDEDVPLAYQPDLQGWLIPETATDMKDDIDVEELRIQMVATVVRIARDHRTKALIRGLGKDGRTLLIQVAGTVIGTYIWYWLTQH